MIQFVETLKVDENGLKTQQKEILEAIQNKVAQFTEKIKKNYSVKIICQCKQNLNKTSIKKYYEFFYYKEGASEPFAVFRVDVERIDTEDFNKNDENRYIYY